MRKKSRRIAAFLMLSSLKNEEVTQNCCVFDVVKSENEEVTQNCCVFFMLSTLKHEENLAE